MNWLPVFAELFDYIKKFAKKNERLFKLLSTMPSNMVGTQYVHVIKAK